MIYTVYVLPSFSLLQQEIRTPHQTSWPLFGCLTIIIAQGLNEVWKPRLRCFSFMAYKYPWAIMRIERLQQEIRARSRT